MQVISLAQIVGMLGLGSQTHQSLEIKHMDLPAPQAPYSFLGYYLFHIRYSSACMVVPRPAEGWGAQCRGPGDSFLSACLTQQVFCL